FSSRRRHTRFSRDWSSDVCSSDLTIFAALGSLFFASGVVAADDQREALRFFETEIRPLLAAECFDCHGAEKSKGGLRLDHRELRSEERRVGKEGRDRW